MDSTVSLPAAKRLVGGGHYVYTLQTARKNCIETYQNDLNNWKTQQHIKEIGSVEDSSFFILKCLEK